MYYRQYWNEPRIQFSSSYGPITHNHPPRDMIWVPDITIPNAISITRVINSVRTIIRPNGDIYLSER